jgi:hypothetical protein
VPLLKGMHGQLAFFRSIGLLGLENKLFCGIKA